MGPFKCYVSSREKEGVCVSNFRCQVQLKTARTCPVVVVVVDTTMLGAWPKMPTSIFSQSRGRISSQQKFSVVDL